MKRHIIFGLAALAAIAAPPLAGQGNAEEKLKVAFIEFAQTSGSSWVRANFEGTKYLEAHDPNIEVTRVDAISEGPNVVPVMNSLIAKGNTVLFLNGYGFGTFVPEVAKKHPDVHFVVQMSEPTGPNITSYYGKLEEARYLEGVLAGKMTKTNVIGFVGGFPYSPVVSGANAFTLGVRSVNPQAKVIATWANSWYDPPKEKEAADSVLAAGADIVVNHCDSSATLQAAAAKGKWGMTSNADWSSAAPAAFLSGTAWNWGPYYVKIVKEIEEKKFDTTRYIGSLADGIVMLLPFNSAVPEDARQAVEAAKKKIISGELKIFAGPIEDNQGKLRIPAGQVMDHAEATAKMDWLVAGIQGSTK